MGSHKRSRQQILHSTIFKNTSMGVQSYFSARSCENLRPPRSGKCLALAFVSMAKQLPNSLQFQSLPRYWNLGIKTGNNCWVEQIPRTITEFIVLIAMRKFEALPAKIESIEESIAIGRKSKLIQFTYVHNKWKKFTSPQSRKAKHKSNAWC